MISVNATEARKAFFDLLKQANQQHEVIRVQHKSGNSVLLSEDDYESMQETLHLLTQPGFFEAFNKSVQEANSGDTLNFEEVFGEPL